MSGRKENSSEIHAHGIYRSVKLFLQSTKLLEISIMTRSSYSLTNNWKQVLYNNSFLTKNPFIDILWAAEKSWRTILRVIFMFLRHYCNRDNPGCCILSEPACCWHTQCENNRNTSCFIHQNIWGGPWENVSYAICEQHRRRSACASAQSDQHLCCSLLR